MKERKYLFKIGEISTLVEMVGFKAYSIFSLFPQACIETIPSILISPILFEELYDYFSLQSLENENGYLREKRKMFEDELKKLEFNLGEKNVLRASIVLPKYDSLSSGKYRINSRILRDNSDIFPEYLKMTKELIEKLHYEKDKNVKMAGIIQKLISPKISGMVLSTPDKLLVEYLYGFLHPLTLGQQTPKSIIIKKDTSEYFNSKIPFNIKELIRIESKIRNYVKEKEFLIEWVFDGEKIYATDWRPVLYKDKQYVLFPSVKEKANILKIGKGTPVIRGNVIGKAKIISRQTIDSVENGDICIIDRALPEYASLLQKATAIISETGGCCCHLATIARENCIVSVFGVEGITKKIKTNDKIMINEEGEIYLYESI